MKLLFIGNTAWSMYNFRLPIFQYFLNKKYEVIVVSPFDSIYVPLLQSSRCKYYPVDIEAKGNNPFRDIKTMLQIRKILKKEQPDCCFFYTIKPNIYGSMAAASLNIPYIPITTGLGYVFLVDNLVSKIAKLLYKIAFKKANEVWFLNQDDATSFKQAKLIDESKINIIKGEGIDLNKFEILPHNNGISFLVQARMLWDKGIGIFVDAARILKKKYPDVKFKLLGFMGVDNPNAITENQMNEWIHEGIIEYLGSTNDVRPYIYDSTCIVLPSYYREGIPFSLMEGAAAGKPIITTDNVGCREVVEDGVTGYLCKIKDSVDLADKMEKVILMPEFERNQMGLKGREKMKNEFGIDIVINKYVEILKTIK